MEQHHTAKESHLTVIDFLMSEADAAEIHKWAVRYMMQYMVSAFATSLDLKQFVTDEVPSHPVGEDRDSTNESSRSFEMKRKKKHC